MQETPASTKYGTARWFDRQYRTTPDDPWGLDWRPSQRFRYRVMLAALSSSWTSTGRPATIIDVGCATGTFTSMLARLCTQGAPGVIGVDIAAAAIERAAARHPTIRFEQLSLEEASERFAGQADLVTCLEVLYYVPASERIDALRRLAALLRPGGRLLVSSMIARPPYFYLEALRDLVAQQLPVVASGAVHLGPVVRLEKLMMRVAPGVTRALGRQGGDEERQHAQRVLSAIESFCRRFLGRRAESHGFVLARLGDR